MGDEYRELECLFLPREEETLQAHKYGGFTSTECPVPTAMGSILSQRGSTFRAVECDSCSQTGKKAVTYELVN